MNTKSSQSLVQRLETLRDVSDLYVSPIGKEVMRDIERLAMKDLPGAVRLWKDHAPAALQQPGAEPVILKIGALIESRFEGRQRQSYQVPDLPDAMILRAQPGNTYEGQIVGRTPGYAVMRQGNGDHVLHRHKDLTLDVSALPERVLIEYRTDLGDIGIVREAAPLDVSARHDAAMESGNSQASTQFTQAQHAYESAQTGDGRALEAAGDTTLSEAAARVNILKAEPGMTYEGPVRETRDGRVIQRLPNGRYISHNARLLAGQRFINGQSIQIKYASGSQIGLVSEIGKPDLQRETGLQRENSREMA
jgi:hypothetical protein